MNRKLCVVVIAGRCRIKSKQKQIKAHVISLVRIIKSRRYQSKLKLTTKVMLCGKYVEQGNVFIHFMRKFSTFIIIFIYVRYLCLWDIGELNILFIKLCDCHRSQWVCKLNSIKNDVVEMKINAMIRRRLLFLINVFCYFLE